MPTDPPLVGVLRELDDEGYTSQFVPLEGGRVRCTARGHDFDAAEVHGETSRRLEGASDPADMLLVVALRCPVDGAPGTLVLHYGPESSAEESDVLAAIDLASVRSPGTGGLGGEPR